MEQVVSQKKLPLQTKIVYGFGDWGTAGATNIRNLYWLFFLVNIVGVAPKAATSAILLGKLWDSVNDPLIGMLSDQIETRWGRRRPFWLFGVVPFTVLFVLLFAIPPLEGRALVIYYGVIYLLFDTAYTVINVPYTAIMPELSEDYDERSSLATWRIGFSLLASLLTAVGFKYMAEELFPSFGLGGGYWRSALIWSISFAIPPLLLFWYLKEPERATGLVGFTPLVTMREIWENRPFRLVALLYLLTFATVDFIAPILVWFFVFCLEVDSGMDSVVLGIVMGVGFLSLPLVLRLLKWWDKRQIFLWTVSCLAILLVAMSQIPAGKQSWLIGIAILMGPLFGAANVLPWALVADVIEVDELQTGKRREGVYSGYLVLLRKLGGAVGIFLIGHLLAWSGFVEGSLGQSGIEQPEAALQMLRFLVGGIPFILLSSGWCVGWYYPLSRENYERVRNALQQKRLEIKEDE